jgi:hypothetical protein
MVRSRVMNLGLGFKLAFDFELTLGFAVNGKIG